MPMAYASIIRIFKVKGTHYAHVKPETMGYVWVWGHLGPFVP